MVLLREVAMDDRKERARRVAEMAYVAAAVDFLRAVAGEGRPEALYQLMYNCLMAETAFMDESGGEVVQPHDIAFWLRLDRREIERQQNESDEDFKQRVESPDFRREDAAREVQRHALRVTAAEMALALSQSNGEANALRRAQRDLDEALAAYCEATKPTQ